MNTSDIYETSIYSLTTSRTLLSETPQSQSYCSLPEQIRANPNRRVRVDKECERLKASIFRARVVFFVLVAICAFLLFLYVAVIYILLTALQEITNKPRSEFSHQHGGFRDTGSGNGEGGIPRGWCVGRKEVRGFVDEWKPEDKQSIWNLLKTGNYVRTHKPNVIDEYCFRNITWVMDVLGKINTAVGESLDYIKGKQREITNTTECCSSQDEEELRICYAGNATKQDDGAEVLAHFHLNTTAKYSDNKDDDMNVLQWATGSDSVNQSIGAIAPIRQLIVQRRGFYYVYSRVTFKKNVTATHRVVLNRKGISDALLSYTGVVAEASNVRGIFELQPGDALSVNATTRHLLQTETGLSSYFGIYLVRV